MVATDSIDFLRVKIEICNLIVTISVKY